MPQMNRIKYRLVRVARKKPKRVVFRAKTTRTEPRHCASHQQLFAFSRGFCAFYAFCGVSAGRVEAGNTCFDLRRNWR